MRTGALTGRLRCFSQHGTKVLFTWHLLLAKVVTSSLGKLRPKLTFPSCGFFTSLGNVLNWEFPVRSRHVRKVYPSMPFDLAESELARELELYYQAIHSYPDHFAKSRLTFQRHLFNMMNVVEAGARSQGADPHCIRSAS